MPKIRVHSANFPLASMPGRLLAVAALAGLAACGGGGGGGASAGVGSGGSPAGGGNGVSWTAGVYQPSSSLAAQCASPRSGTDPGTGAPFPDRQGTVASENNWLRSWTNELYLWFSEVPDDNPNSTATTAAYFGLLKTSATTPSGNPKDKFHFTYDTAAWRSLSQSGVSAGYGLQWVILASRPPRRVVVAYTEPNSPAASANLTRGAEAVTVDGIDVVNESTQSGVATLNAGLFPTAAGQVHTFTVRDAGSSTTRTLTMQSVIITSAPVQDVHVIATAGGPVGYMLFNDHIATAEPAFIDGINTLKAANVTDLVLDIRYNGGGYLDIADEVAYMIAGAGPTAGRTFERTVFNSKYPTTDPVTGKPLSPIPFHTTTQGFTSSTPSGQPLPTLNLQRVYLLTGSGTCSASESIINSLRGVGVQVIQIGSTTCGKPYGFYPQDNCGTTYFSIQFQGVNDQGFGDYPDGFSPINTTSMVGVQLPGCSVADDFTRALGDANEGRLAAALAYRMGAVCPAPSGFAPQKQIMQAGASNDSVSDGLLYRSPWRENRILRER